MATIGNHHSGSLGGSPGHPVLIPKYQLSIKSAEQEYKERGTTTQGKECVLEIIEDLLEVTI